MGCVEDLQLQLQLWLSVLFVLGYEWSAALADGGKGLDVYLSVMLTHP